MRNEEAHLPRCLASVRGLVDEIVVVDTGSTDRTVAIARDFGARVVTFAWRDDFSLARNVSLEHATGEWILVLDADEALAARDHAAIRHAIAEAASDGSDGFIVPQRHYLTGGLVVGWQPGPGGYDEGLPYPGFCDVDCLRLFRNRPSLRFRHRVHETLTSLDPAEPLRTAPGSWVIHHFGKASAASVLEAKNAAYVRIGLKKIDDDPRDAQAHYELGILYSELEQFDKALPCFERAASLSPRLRDTALRIAICLARRGDDTRALAAFRDAARRLPHLAGEIALEEGQIHVRLGDDTAAERAFRRALDRHPRLPVTRASLARLLAKQHRFQEAIDCLTPLGESDDPDICALRGATALGLGDLATATTHLRRSVSLRPSYEAALNLSSALAATGDADRAIEAVADALGMPERDQAAMTRFQQLAGPRFAQRARPESADLRLFFYQPQSIPFDARTPRTHGLGGTESAIVYLAEALTRLGVRVAVFNNCPEPGWFDGVEYARWETMPRRAVADRPDVIVSARAWELVGQVRLAPLQIHWSLDAFDQPFLRDLANADRRREIDFFVLHSDWQAETFAAHHRVPEARVLRSRLGVAASAAIPPRRPAVRPRGRRLAYASTPFRGLDVALTVFRRIRAACPDAELDVFSSMQVYGVSADADRARFAALYQSARQPGVNLVGTVPQLELAERLQQARVLAYPNHFAETFCVAAIEAEAAGCVVVTSHLGALPETVGEGGVCLHGDPHGAAYQQAFVDACVSLLTDEARWEALSQKALSRTWTHYTWDAVAADWHAWLTAAVAPEPAIVGRIAAHLAAGRGRLAQRMFDAQAHDAARSSDAWGALAAAIAWQAGAAEPPEIDTLRRLALHFPSLRSLSEDSRCLSVTNS